MIQLNVIKSNGDDTYSYSVRMYKSYTFQEFVNEILKRKEWGYIGIHKERTFFGDPRCEYEGNKLLNELPSEIMGKTVIKAEANGGWSRMDWILHI